jgi:hypothetical protein
MKLIHGDFFQQAIEWKFKLIIADIPYMPLWNYQYVFRAFVNLLEEDGVLAVTVDSGAVLQAFLTYVEAGRTQFNCVGCSAFEDGNSWGNLILFMHKNKAKRVILPSMIHLIKGSGIHPNSKDKKLYETIVGCLTSEGDRVLDPFMGEGNTAKVCKEMNRDFTGIEIEKEWFDEAAKG